jgi:hypothetical protein
MARSCSRLYSRSILKSAMGQKQRERSRTSRQPFDSTALRCSETNAQPVPRPLDSSSLIESGTSFAGMTNTTSRHSGRAPRDPESSPQPLDASFRRHGGISVKGPQGIYRAKWDWSAQSMLSSTRASKP